MLAFFEKHDNFVTVRLVEIRNADGSEGPVNSNIYGLSTFDVTLQDRDHQNLIETVSRIWPDWKDGDVSMARREARAS